MDFLIGGISASCAGLFSNPFDVIKIHQQLHGELQKILPNKPIYMGMITTAKNIVQSEGITALQKGLTPALMLQFVMNSIRLGLYETADNKMSWTHMKGDQKHSLALCVLWGGFSGALGTIVSCPLYRMKVQAQAPKCGNCKKAARSIRQIYRRNGTLGLWKGCSVLIPRTMVGSSAQLASFTKSKDFFTRYESFHQSTTITAVSASIVSGVCSAICMTPLDVVCTRLFSQKLDKNGRGLIYSGIHDCFLKIIRNEGVSAIYKGFFSNLWRLAPHTVLSLTFWEHFKKYYSDIHNEEMEV